jgi:hypothetical protein
VTPAVTPDRFSPRLPAAPRAPLGRPLAAPRALLAAALLLAGLCAPAAAQDSIAQDFPKLRPGLWQMDRASERAAGAPNTMTVCLDDSVQKEILGMGVGAMQGMCSKHDFSFSGGRGTGDFICDFGGSKMHSTSTIVMNGDTSYRTEIRTTYDPPLMGQAQMNTVVNARRIGACKPGQRPGDMVMPNGQTLNMRDMMGGARPAPPARRAPQPG